MAESKPILVCKKRLPEDCEPYVYEVHPGTDRGTRTLVAVRVPEGSEAAMRERLVVSTDVLEAKYVRYVPRMHGPMPTAAAAVAPPKPAAPTKPTLVESEPDEERDDDENEENEKAEGAREDAGTDDAQA